MSRRSTADIAREEIERGTGQDDGQIIRNLPKDQLMDVARQFAKILLDEAEADRDTSPQSRTEEIAREIDERPSHYFHHRLRTGNLNETDEDIDRGIALRDFAADQNESASFDGEERFKNVFDVEDVLNTLAAAVQERRGGR